MLAMGRVHIALLLGYCDHVGWVYIAGCAENVSRGRPCGDLPHEIDLRYTGQSNRFSLWRDLQSLSRCEGHHRLVWARAVLYGVRPVLAYRHCMTRAYDIQ